MVDYYVAERLRGGEPALQIVNMMAHIGVKEFEHLYSVAAYCTKMAAPLFSAVQLKVCMPADNPCGTTTLT